MWIWKVTHTGPVYDRIRPHTIIYDRIRQSYSSVYGVETVTFKSLRIFIRSPYTVSVSHRFTPYTVLVHGSCVRPPYISVFHRKRSFTTVHVRPGYLLVYIQRLDRDLFLNYKLDQALKKQKTMSLKSQTFFLIKKKSILRYLLTFIWVFLFNKKKKREVCKWWLCLRRK